MKKFFIMLTAAIALCACSKEDEGGKEITLTGGTQTTQTVYADETTKSDGIKFNAIAPWTATVREVAARAGGSDAEWLQLSAYEGKAGEQTLTLTFKENTSGADRRAEIRIVCGGTTITIVVEQKGTTQSGDNPKPEPTSSFITPDGKITGGEIFGDHLPSELSWMIMRMDESGDSNDIVVSSNKVPYVNKNFNIVFPTPDANLLGGFNSSEASTKPTIQPADTKFTGGEVGYKMEDRQMSLELTNISLENLKRGEDYRVKKGEGYVRFFYATNEVTINGTLHYPGDVQTFKFANCKFNKGWNEMVLLAENDAATDGTVVINVTANNANKEFKWMAEGYEEQAYAGYLVTSITRNDGDNYVINFTYNKNYKISSITEYGNVYTYTHFSDHIVANEPERGVVVLQLSDAGQIVSADSPTMQRRFTYNDNLQLTTEVYTPINGGEDVTRDYTTYDWQTAGKVTAVTFLSDREYTTSVYEFSTEVFSDMSNLNLFTFLADVGYNPISWLRPYYIGGGPLPLISKVTTTGDKWNKDNGVWEFRYELTPDNTRITKIYKTTIFANGSRSSEHLFYTITYDR